MNYLAHAYLSFNQQGILAGNMISDYVKGSKQYDYSAEVQVGIRLHRFIDHFTDTHPLTKSAKQFLQPAVGAYSGAFVDVIFDHFLALDTNEFVNDDVLQTFALATYEQLFFMQDVLPEVFQRQLPYMKEQNWLYNYRFLWGIEKSFHSVTRRAKYLDSYKNCFELFTTHYSDLQQCYQDFFPLLKQQSAQFLANELR